MATTRDDERPARFVWPSDRVARFWRAVRAGRAVTEWMVPVAELVEREPTDDDHRNM